MQSLDDIPTEQWASSEPNPAAAADAHEQAGRAARLLQRLPQRQREVLVLKFQHALSYREISEATGLSIGNVGFLIHTALKALRHGLERETAQTRNPERRSP